MCKLEFIKELTHLEDSVRNTENFLSLLRDDEKINKLEKLYKKVKDIRSEGIDITVLASYNIFSRSKREKNLDIAYISISTSDLEKIGSKYGIIKEKNKILITL